ncbi:MAG TPA: LysR family transcriptional regulator, partial [Rhizomicrobium sp.]|nr:LysR family transcriptional regulator [Rhizomicrobium sp.]
MDHIAVFLAVVEAGSFAGAARRLGRATSVISYAIANLEAQLGVTLLARAGTARPRLTDAGQAILADSRNLAIALDGLLAKARGLTSGLEAEVSLVVDVMLPARKLVRALDDFRKKFPTVGLRLEVEALGAVTHAVIEGTAAFGVSGPLELANDLLTRGPAGSVRLVAVAAPDHPLAQIAGPVSASAVRDHIQLVLS